MTNLSLTENHIQSVSNFQDLVSRPDAGEVNAICWKRELQEDFSEIVKKVKPSGNITVIDMEELRALALSEQGQLAREVLLNDYELLKAHGASPTLNVITHYERDETQPFFPTDVYSFHVDRSPIPTHTFLCTYYGAPSELVANEQTEQKVLVEEIRNELKKLHTGADTDFESFLSEHFFDLHYRAKPNAEIVNLGLGNLWRLAVDHPESKVLPCIHRAPLEKPGESRLLMIC